MDDTGHSLALVVAREPELEVLPEDKSYLIRGEGSELPKKPGQDLMKSWRADYSDFGKAVKPSAPKLAAAFGIKDWSFPAPCDPSGCDLKITIVNKGGAGSVRAVLTAENGGQPLGECRIDVPEMDYKATADLSCRVAGSGLNDYADSSHGGRVHMELLPAS